MLDDYLAIKQVADKWGVNPRTVRNMCANGKIEGATKIGRDWLIPSNAKRPVDGRITTGEYKNWRKSKGAN